MDNNILPESENVLRKNTVVKGLYKLEVSPKISDKKYLFKIMEFERERSYLRDFKLVRVIHHKKINVGVLDNKIVAFKDFILPSSIKDKDNKSWTKKLSSQNDKTIFRGKTGDTLIISFDNIQNFKNPYLVLRSNLRADCSRVDEIGQKLEKTSSEKELLNVLRDISVASLAVAKSLDPKKALAAYPCKLCVNISLLYKDENREKLIEIVHPREKLSLGIVDIFKNVKKKQKSLLLKMEWTRPHNISFIGLADASSMTASTIKRDVISLSGLNHSENKNITKEDLKDKKVELSPGQYVKLEFATMEKKINSNEKTSFFLSSEGYYIPI